MRRTLYTIGDLGSVGRVGRGRRRSLGQTNPLFRVPAGFSDQTAGSALLTALNDMLLAWDQTGVPSEHVSDPFALAFQRAWNADPTIAAAGGNALLSVDGGYGDNVETAVMAINGGSAPTVNSGSAPATPTNPTTPATHPIVVAHEGEGGSLLVGGLVVAGLGLAAWLLFAKKKKHTASITFHQPVRSNPRRARHRNPMACM